MSLSLDYDEWKEIEERANKEHLAVATYIRFYLFKEINHFDAQPIESVRSGIPKRIVSSQIVHAIKRTDEMGEVLKEMQSLFKNGLKLKEVTPEMRAQVYKNRELPEFDPKINIEELHPPQ